MSGAVYVSAPDHTFLFCSLFFSLSLSLTHSVSVCVREYVIERRQWSRLDASNNNYISGPSPAARIYGTGVILPPLRTWFIFGGIGGRATLSDPHFLSLDRVNIGGDARSEEDGRVTYSHDVLSLIYFSPTSVLRGQIPPTFTWLTVGSAVTYNQWTDPDSSNPTPPGFVRYIIRHRQVISTGAVGGLPITQPLLITNPFENGTNVVTIACDVTCFQIQTDAINGPLTEVIGLEMVNGTGDGRSSGGAMVITGSNTHVRISDCRFINNQVSGLVSVGGAISINRAGVSFARCLFQNNRASLLGGAIHALAAVLVFSGCMFEGNMVTESLGDGMSNNALLNQGQGGALALVVCTTVISDCSFTSNRASNGGAITALNVVKQAASMEALTDLTAVVIRTTRTTFINNTALLRGGAIYMSQMNNDGTSYSYFNTGVFTGNQALNGSGGAMYLQDSNMKSDRTSFVSNTAGLASQSPIVGVKGGGGGGCIFWAPTVSTDPSIVNKAPQVDRFTASLNEAKYGSIHATVPFAIQLIDGSASNRDQVSGQLISPPIVVALIDLFGQITSTEQDAFISIQPSWAFAGQTAVQVRDGIANFSALTLRLAPTTMVRATFSASIPLPLLNATLSVPIRSQICLPGSCLDFDDPLQCRACYPVCGINTQPSHLRTERFERCSFSCACAVSSNVCLSVCVV